MSKIKRYELNDNISIKLLEKAKFIKGGYIKNVKNPKMYYSKELGDDIELHIEVPIDNLNDIDFNDDNIMVFDKVEEELYWAFYEEGWNFPFLNKIINQYNKTMDSLVEKGIFKEKTIKSKEVIR